MALSRCIFEAATNLRFLILKNDDALYNAYVLSGLGPEKELFDRVTANVKARGAALPIEERMLDSVTQMCRSSGLKIEDVPSGHPVWGGSVRDRVQALGLPDHAYVSIQRFPSHAVHGTWPDLLFHNLIERQNESGEPEFAPNCNSGTLDERLLGPVALYALAGGVAYLKRFFGDAPDLKILYDRITDLEARIMRVMNADEQNVQKRHGQMA